MFVSARDNSTELGSAKTTVCVYFFFLYSFNDSRWRRRCDKSVTALFDTAKKELIF